MIAALYVLPLLKGPGPISQFRAKRYNNEGLLKIINSTMPVTNDRRFNLGRFENQEISRKAMIQLRGNNKKSRIFENIKYITSRTNVEV
jgi:hypothetical protein